MIRFSETLVGTNLNSIWLEGVLVDDPQLGEPDSDGLQFQIQTPRPPEDPSVFQVEAAETALDGSRGRLARGRTVRIIGRLRQHRWTDARGERHEAVRIIGELVEPVGFLN